MKKTIISSLLAASMLYTVGTPAMAARAGFTDVPENAWYAEAVQFCVENDLMSGTSATEFAPNTTMTRSMLAAVLYRRAGSPAVSGKNLFSDVADGAWYTDAVIWAQQNGLISGYGDGLFGTADPVTREQIASILWRAAGSPAAEAGEDFADETAISAFAAAAVDWARAEGIVSGKTGNLFDLKGSATRAEVASILMNSTPETPDENPDGTENPDGPENPDGTETPDGTENPDGTETPDGSEKPDGTETPDGPEKPDGAETPDSSDDSDETENPAGSENSGETEKPDDSEKPNETGNPDDSETGDGTKGSDAAQASLGAEDSITWG